MMFKIWYCFCLWKFRIYGIWTLGIREAFIKKTFFLTNVTKALTRTPPSCDKKLPFSGQKWPFQEVEIFNFNPFGLVGIMCSKLFAMNVACVQNFSQILILLLLYFLPLLASQKWCFFGNFVDTSKRYGERETFLTLLKIEAGSSISLHAVTWACMFANFYLFLPCNTPNSLERLRVIHLIYQGQVEIKSDFLKI